MQTTATGGGYTYLVILSHRESMGTSWEASLSLAVTHSLHRLKYSPGWLCNTWMPECWPINMRRSSLLPRVFRSNRRSLKRFQKFLPPLKGGWVAYVV